MTDNNAMLMGYSPDPPSNPGLAGKADLAGVIFEAMNEAWAKEANGHEISLYVMAALKREGYRIVKDDFLAEVRKAVDAIDHFQVVAAEAIDFARENPEVEGCQSDPCHFCTAGSNLQTLAMDVADALDAL